MLEPDKALGKDTATSLLLKMPDPTGEEPTLKLWRLPFLSKVGDLWRPELAILPAAEATEDVGEAEETDRLDILSWFLLPFGRPGPCLLCLFPFLFFSFTASSSTMEDCTRLYPDTVRLEFTKSPGTLSKFLVWKDITGFDGRPIKELKLLTVPSCSPGSPLDVSLVDGSC